MGTQATIRVPRRAAPSKRVQTQEERLAASKRKASQLHPCVPSDDEEGDAALDSMVEAQAKRQRVVKGLEEEFVCPISQELFIDPVTAEDGRVYEREKIARWFQECEDDQSSSPVTNEPMGFQLFPAYLVKSTLARLVEHGVVVGPLVDTWKASMAKKEEERKKLAALKQRAEAGEVEAMAELGVSYDKGWLGLEADGAQAFNWSIRAAQEGHATASCRTGIMFLKGKSIPRNERRGCEFMFSAAVLGSEHACEFVGHCYAYSLHEYPYDAGAARFWFLKMERCKHKDSVENTRERARRWLQRNAPGSPSAPDSDASELEDEEERDGVGDTEVEGEEEWESNNDNDEYVVDDDDEPRPA
jgi:hypothetical protein